MSPTLILLRKSLLTFRRAKAGLVITFVVPIVLIYLFGHVFGLYRSDSGPNGIPVGVVNASTEPAAQQLVEALKSERAFRVITETQNPDGTSRPLTEADARAALTNNAYRFAIILPADLLPDDSLGIRLKFLSTPRNEIEAQTVNGVLQKTIFSSVPQLLGQSLQKGARRYLGDDRFKQFNRSIAGAVSNAFGGDPAKIQSELEAGHFMPGQAAEKPSDPGLRRLDQPAATISNPTTNQTVAPTTPATARATPDLLSRLVKIDTEQVAGKEVKNPMAARIVGGYAIMFLLFAVSAGANTFFEEKSSGVFQRLLASPVRPAHILWARFLFGIVLGVAQISALFIAGNIFFGLNLLPNAAALLVVAISAAAACSAFGMLIVAVSPSHSAASGLATFIVISMSAVGGAWFPVSFMPDYIQVISKFTLVYWSVEGFTDVLWAGKSMVQVLPTVGILLGMAAVVMVISVWQFKRSRLFE